MILIDEFISNFEKVKDLPMFAWVSSICDGYRREYLNIDEGKAQDLTRRITSISNERFKI